MVWLYLLGVFALGIGVGMVIEARLLAGEVARIERGLDMALALSTETANHMTDTIHVHRGIYDQDLERLSDGHLRVT